LKRQLNLANQRVYKIGKGEFAHTVIRKVIHKTLVGPKMLSTAQANWYLDISKGKERSRSKQWSNVDWADALEIKGISDRALDMVRKKLPLPSSSACRTKYSWIHITPGPIVFSLEYIKMIMPGKEPYQSLSGLIFDEMKVNISLIIFSDLGDQKLA
jgi:hypothetical protein